MKLLIIASIIVFSLSSIRGQSVTVSNVTATVTNESKDPVTGVITATLTISMGLTVACTPSPTPTPTPTPSPTVSTTKLVLQIGDSNNYYGAPLDPAVDVGHPRLFEYAAYGSAPRTIHLAQDPFGVPEWAWSNDPADKIGSVGAWARAYLNNNPTHRIIVVPWSKGGSGGFNGWGVGEHTINATQLYNDAHQAAVAQFGSAEYLVVFSQFATNDLLGRVPSSKFRKHLYATINYIRARTRPDLPIVIEGLPHHNYIVNPINTSDGLPSWYGPQSGSEVRAILSSVRDKFAFTGYVDSESPSNIGDSVHFTAADQRELAARKEPARLAAEANTDPILSFDPNDKGLNMNLATGAYANSDVSSGATAVWNSVRATRGRNSGKYYVEFQIVGAGGNRMVGLSNGALYNSTYMGDPDATANGSNASYWGGQANQATTWTLDWANTPAAWADGDVAMIAVDFSTGKAWIGRNGTWGNAGDPAAGTGSWISVIPAGQTIWPTVSMHANENTIKLRRSAQISYSPPAGFSAWD